MKNDAYDAVLLSVENFHYDKGVLYPPSFPPPLSVLFDNIPGFDESINHILLSNLNG